MLKRANKRRKIPDLVASRVLTAAARRCCLCVGLHNDLRVKKGQLAHLDKQPHISTFENLVWLCFDHHDEFDSVTSQSKGLTANELAHYRSELYRMRGRLKAPTTRIVRSVSRRSASSDFRATVSKSWRFPQWQVGNLPELFAYRAQNGSDGVCLIERIDLPSKAVVIACIQVAGNPGNSITNCVEELCGQVCGRFSIDPKSLIWLEHYDYYDDEWSWVKFGTVSPKGRFENPEWTRMTPSLWHALQLRPRATLTSVSGKYESKLEKLFPWPSEVLGLAS